MMKYIVFFLTNLTCCIATAQVDTDIAPPIISEQSTSSMILMIGLLAIIIGLLWLSKYIIRARQSQTDHPLLSMKVIGTLPLSLKDKIIVVEIEDAWLVIGSTQSSLNILYTMGRPSDEENRHQIEHSSIPQSVQEWFHKKLHKTSSCKEEQIL